MVVMRWGGREGGGRERVEGKKGGREGKGKKGVALRVMKKVK